MRPTSRPDPKGSFPLEVLVTEDAVIISGLDRLSVPVLCRLAVEVAAAYLSRLKLAEMRAARSDLYGMILGRTGQ